MSLEKLRSLNAGFRERFLDFQALSGQLRAWADAFPDLVRITAIGETEEGRPILLATIGPEPDRIRPAVYVDGNMHAIELCGSSVALAIAEDVLALHLAPDTALRDLPPAVARVAREALFYVLPRMSPDGAEHLLTTGRYCRSSPRNQRPNRGHPHWVTGDVNGDGQVRVMRVLDAAGDFVESDEVPNLMVQRRVEDEGPFYRLYPEGTIANFDGQTIPAPSSLSDNETDLNRNFPWQWWPAYEQDGAGAFPGSEPESRAVLDFTSRHPEIFAWLNLHTFGGVAIRPLGHQPDEEMNRFDLSVYDQVGAWLEESTGYPMVSGYQEFTHEPDKPLRGDMTDYGYHQRGTLCYVVELWDLFNQLGIDRKPRFIEHYTQFGREEAVALAHWDRLHNQGRVFGRWEPFVHPQLGELEIGGIDARIGLWNPPLDRLAGICASQADAFLRVAAMIPRVRMGEVEVSRVAAGLTRLRLTVSNLGYLPTCGLDSARKLDFNEPVYADVETEGCELVDARDAHREVGHLEGWGNGLHAPSAPPYYARSPGNASSRALTYTLRGPGLVRIRVGSCRVGWLTRAIEI